MRFSAPRWIFFQLEAFGPFLQKGETRRSSKMQGAPDASAVRKTLAAHRKQQEKGASECKEHFLSDLLTLIFHRAATQELQRRRHTWKPVRSVFVCVASIAVFDIYTTIDLMFAAVPHSASCFSLSFTPLPPPISSLIGPLSAGGPRSRKAGTHCNLLPKFRHINSVN